MKTKIVPRLVVAALIAVLSFLFCGDLQDPWTDPSNARIDGDRSLKNLPAVLNTFQTYECSLYVFLPYLLDSIKIVRQQGNADTIVYFKSTPTEADTVVTALFSITSKDLASIKAYIFRKNGTVDSIIAPLSTQYPRIASIVLPPKMTVFREYPCSLHVFLPQLIDSIRIMFRIEGMDALVNTIQDVTGADSIVTFPLTVTEGRQDSLVIAVFCSDIAVDSLKQKLHIQYSPSITSDSMTYHIYIRDTASVKFTITDLDGDISEGKLWIDSTTGTSVSPPLAGTNREQASLSIDVSAPRFDTILVFAQAFDSSANSSAFASCTVFVMDTAKPRLTLLRITPSIDDSIVNKLPCSLLVKIKDDSPIDSAAYALNPFIKRPMTMINDTVALAVIADLDSGANSYEAQAWDKAGNLGTLQVPILYTGSTVYHFTFSNIGDRTINENGTFPSINLDNTITLDPPPVGVPNWKANVIWQILETKPDSGIRPTLNPTTRVVTFAVPDSEWNGSESFTFIASLTDFATGYAGAIYKVNPINDAPVITWKTVIKAARSPFDTIYADKCVNDPDNPSGSITWIQDTTRGKIYTLQWVSSLRLLKPAAVSPPIETGMFIIDFWTRKWNVVVKNPKSVFLVGSTYIDTLRMIARDPVGAADTQEVIIRATY